jgi:hypothetical protein
MMFCKSFKAAVVGAVGEEEGGGTGSSDVVARWDGLKRGQSAHDYLRV